jgi:hypothetical protein
MPIRFATESAGSVFIMCYTRITNCAAVVFATAMVSTSFAQVTSVFVDSRSNIFGYGELTPAPSGGGGGVVAVTINLTPGTNRVATFFNTGTAWWNASAGSNGPDGGNFAANTNIPAVGPISGYSAARSGHLVGLFLEAGSPVGLTPPPNFAYANASSLVLPSYSPAIRQVFYIGDGLTATGSGATQQFFVPDSATRLILGIADAFGFQGQAGAYNDNTGGYNANCTIVPAPSAAVLLGLSGLLAARRRR